MTLYKCIDIMNVYTSLSPLHAVFVCGTTILLHYTYIIYMTVYHSTLQLQQLTNRSNSKGNVAHTLVSSSSFMYVHHLYACPCTRYALAVAGKLHIIHKSIPGRTVNFSSFARKGSLLLISHSVVLSKLFYKNTHTVSLILWDQPSQTDAEVLKFTAVSVKEHK